MLPTLQNKLRAYPLASGGELMQEQAEDAVGTSPVVFRGIDHSSIDLSRIVASVQVDTSGSTRDRDGTGTVPGLDARHLIPRFLVAAAAKAKRLKERPPPYC